MKNNKKGMINLLALLAILPMLFIGLIKSHEELRVSAKESCNYNFQVNKGTGIIYSTKYELFIKSGSIVSKNGLIVRDFNLIPDSLSYICEVKFKNNEVDLMNVSTL